jgi:predicted DCC family thiol-disulfide oxidoreductase YuxK
MGLVSKQFVGVLAIVIAWATMTIPDTLKPAAGTESWLMIDGHCNLCNGFVNFVADRDTAVNIKFGAQQKYMALVERVGAPTDLSTLILIQGDAHYTLSDAALRTMALLDEPWNKLAVFSFLVPKYIRDFAYKRVAANRYTMFGKTESCRVPTQEFERRWIDYDAGTELSKKFAEVLN